MTYRTVGQLYSQLMIWQRLCWEVIYEASGSFRKGFVCFSSNHRDRNIQVSMFDLYGSYEWLVVVSKKSEGRRIEARSKTFFRQETFNHETSLNEQTIERPKNFRLCFLSTANLSDWLVFIQVDDWCCKCDLFTCHSWREMLCNDDSWLYNSRSRSDFRACCFISHGKFLLNQFLLDFISIFLTCVALSHYCSDPAHHLWCLMSNRCSRTVLIPWMLKYSRFHAFYKVLSLFLLFTCNACVYCLCKFSHYHCSTIAN